MSSSWKQENDVSNPISLHSIHVSAKDSMHAGDVSGANNSLNS